MSKLLAKVEVDEGTPAGPVGGVPAWMPWALVALGGALLAAVVVAMLKGRNAKATGRAAAAELTDLQNRMVEVKKLAASVADELDRRAARLERLIAQADELLERGTDERDDGGGQAAARLRGSRPATGSPAASDELSQRVFSLADQGHTPLQIAQALRQPIGNVELMLALRGGR